MKKIVTLIIFAFCLVAKAESYQSAKVIGFIPYDFQGRELFFVQIEGNVSGGCNTTGRFVIDSSQPRFKSVRAAIMASFYAQLPIVAAYTQTCNTYPNSWDLAYVCVGPIPC